MMRQDRRHSRSMLVVYQPSRDGEAPRGTGGAPSSVAARVCGVLAEWFARLEASSSVVTHSPADQHSAPAQPPTASQPGKARDAAIATLSRPPRTAAHHPGRR